jgi:hypothetical protein
MDCFRYTVVNTLHKGDNKDNINMDLQACATPLVLQFVASSRATEGTFANVHFVNDVNHRKCV